MSDIKVISADDVPTEVAPSIRQTPISGHCVTLMLAGVVVGECTVLCSGCATDEQLDDEYGPETDMISGHSEHDYPGAVCDSCHRVLNTNVLVYSDGPGDEQYEKLTA